jgi:hypothetical protein
MSDTPETDALEQKQSSEGCPQWNDMMRWVREHAALARRLERERDEARHKLELCMAANSDVARIAKERDEAIAARKASAADWLLQVENADRRVSEAKKMAARAVQDAAALADKLRAQNAKLREIAEQAITAVGLWAGSRTNSASQLRADLEQLKEGAK